MQAVTREKLRSSSHVLARIASLSAKRELVAPTGNDAWHAALQTHSVKQFAEVRIRAKTIQPWFHFEINK